MLSLPGYQITEEIYRGGKTIVYRGMKLHDQYPVIFKTLLEALPAPKDLARLQYEFTLLKDWDEEGVIRALALLPYQNKLVLVLQDIGGESVRQLLDKQQGTGQPLPLARFLQLALAFAKSLLRIHQHRIIHKDINPANLVVNATTGATQIIDFGISSQLSRETPQLQSAAHLEGTLAYLSPEQTGRMNRALDYRTDFYSFGITLYEMLTGVPAFAATDPMELVHCHLAKMPLPLDQIRSGLPPVLCELVQKLMAKTAEERYQSAAGLVADLEICLHQFDAEASITHFRLGQHDVSTRFHIPQKLYGRESEVQTLLEAFARISHGQTEMLLVTGYSGVGKTSLVHEVQRPITAKHGYFIEGKFDQFQRDIPWAALIAAFQQLMRQLLTESAARQQRWKALLDEALGANAQVIIEVIPEAALIMGPQLAVAPLPPQEARNRFQASLRKFIEVFAQEAHPLVLFMDDLQWADAASLDLLEELLLKSQQQCLLILGACRDNEVGPSHPLTLVLETLTQAKARFGYIKLEPLSLPDMERLVGDTLTPSKQSPGALASLIAQKTGGNPFFVSTFLTALYEAGCLSCQPGQGGWQWDMAQIEAQQITDNVVELMRQKCRTLPANTQALLVRAACIGHQFDLATLALIAACSPLDAIRDCWPALEAGLLQQRDAVRIEQVLIESTTSASAQVATYRFRFIHDRVQQAAYELLAADETAALHLKIGRLWLRQLDLSQNDDALFAVVSQFDSASALLQDRAELLALAQLNLQAGRKAMGAAAFTSALRYLTTGLALLAGSDRAQQNQQNQQYELTLALTLECAECEYINHQHEAAQAHFQASLHMAKTALEKAGIHLKQLQLYASQGDYLRATEGALAGLRLLGIDLPFYPKRWQLQIQAWKERLHRRGRNARQVLDQLPLAETPQHQLMIQLFCEILRFSYLVSPALNVIAIYKCVNLLYRHGICGDASYIFMSFASLLSMQRQYSLSEIFAQKALQLGQTQSIHCHAKILFLNASFVSHWHQPLATTSQIFDQGLKLSLESGNWIDAVMNMINHLLTLFVRGMELAAFIGLIQKLIPMAEQMNDPLKSINLLHFCLAWATSLAREDADESSGPSLALMAEQAEGRVSDNPNSHLYIAVLSVFYEMLFGNLVQARISLKKARKVLFAVAGMPISTEYFFLNVLLALWDETGSGWREKDPHERALLQKDLDKLQGWASQCPANFEHKYLLCMAEMARLEERRTEAADLYEQAIAAAQKNGFLHHQALANELAGRFYLLQNKPRFAQIYLEQAHALYSQWGALAKARHMEAKYPGLTAKAGPKATPPGGASYSTSTHILKAGVLDLISVMKAAQALSGEMVLEHLLKKLMHILIEGAGAQHGYLLLENHGQWQVEAEADVEQNSVQVLQAQPLIPVGDETDLNLPVALIQYVALTREAVVLDNARPQAKARARFDFGACLSLRQAKSVLCIPILHQGKLVGILYLENRLLEGAFTANRLELLKILSSQAAISIENARVYENLESTVALRTAALSQSHAALSRAYGEAEHAREQAEQAEQKALEALDNLRATQAQLLQSEKMASLGTLTAGVAHEINNPTNFTHVAAQIQGTRLAEFEQFLLSLMEENPDPLLVAELTKRFAALQENVTLMLNGTGRIKRIVQDLRAFTRSEEAEKKSVPLSECLNATLNLVRASWLEKVEFITDYADDPPWECWPALLNQVFMNLMVNGCQAIAARQQQGGSKALGQLWLRLYLNPEPGELVIEIEDNGIGIEAEVLPRILEPFYTTKDVGVGTGLGLSISYGIIQKHHGTLSITSTPGMGSCFTIHLPWQK
jgi:predicted ATPase/signal transduction histidine kinase